MFINYLKIAFRNLLKFKSFSIINIFGLAIGIASCVLIMLFVVDELSYDQFYKNSDRIYRIHTEVKIGDNESKMAVSPGILSYALQNEIPEVEKAVRLRWIEAPVLKYGNKVFSEESVLWVDSTFFEVFNCEFIEGSPETALKTNDALVITESMRSKYFGKGNAVGNVITQDFASDLVVTAVIKDFPHNSHFRVDFLENLASVPPHPNDTRWMASNFFTYVLLREGTELKNFQDKLDGLVVKYAAPQIEAFTGEAFEKLSDKGSYYRLKYQPLTDIHLYSNLLYELDVNSDVSYVYIFSIIAFVILMIACINFINLSTARSTTRAKEVGIRKTLGSNRIKLIAQFLTESVVISLTAVLLALVIINISLPFFNNVSGKNLYLSLTDNYFVLPVLMLFAISIGILAGLYPAFLLTSFNPVKVIKGEKQFKGRSYWLRNGLVVFQFAVTVILFIGTLIVESQLNYMQNKNLGYDKEQLLVIEKSNDLNNRFESFKADLLRNPSILNVSSQNTIPGRGFGNTVYKMEKDESNGNYQMMIWFADYDLIDTYKIKMTEGRYFSEEFPTDSNAVVINEAAKKAMGLETAVGKRLFDTSAEPWYMQIVGVLEDFHFESMHTQVRPMIIIPQRSTGNLTTVRIAGGNISSVVGFIEDTWEKYSDGQAFQFVFMDDEFNRIYAAELKTGELFTSFSLLAMIIACLGLFGLSAFITMQKTKEIGIRKVMGASIENILYLLVKQFTKWVIIANLIAWPLSYWMMNNWLESFAYRVEINYSIFILSAAVSLVVALITVSSQVISAASKNPVISLKYE